MPNLIAAVVRPAPLLRFVSGALFVLMVALLFYLSAEPAGLPLIPPPWDKAVHLGYYAALAVLLVVAAGGRGVLIAVLIVVMVGAADELYQSTVPQRHADWLDWAADIVGATIGAAVFAWLAAGRTT